MTMKSGTEGSSITSTTSGEEQQTVASSGAPVPNQDKINQGQDQNQNSLSEKEEKNEGMFRGLRKTLEAVNQQSYYQALALNKDLEDKGVLPRLERKLEVKTTTTTNADAAVTEAPLTEISKADEWADTDSNGRGGTTEGLGKGVAVDVAPAFVDGGNGAEKDSRDEVVREEVVGSTGQEGRKQRKGKGGKKGKRRKQ